jgi:porphobilinogen synthase
MHDYPQFSPDTAAEHVKHLWGLGVKAVLLFGVTGNKDASGSQAWADDAAVQQTVKRIKDVCAEIAVITDVCLCAYTDHGHCGVVEQGKIVNDKTCQLLAKTALSHARAGADMVAPSDMMDGRVGEIRLCLEENGFDDVGIMAYSAKFASAFYGPFRDAADSTPAFGDRKTYQMDPANARQAMRQMSLDIDQGADIVMVKPALAYLDIINEASKKFDCPIAAYNVSGEYMMINNAAKAGSLDRDAAIIESLCSIKRAGANIIITYFAEEAAALL